MRRWRDAVGSEVDEGEITQAILFDATLADCTLTKTMVLNRLPLRAVLIAAFGFLSLASVCPHRATGQQAPDPLAQVRAAEASSIALPLPEDRGDAAVEQSLKRLRTTASLMMIVAHPDDEDGALLTYLSRGMGVRCTLFTLTRGEGGQNAMSADTDDALGIIRTNELLRASEFYGAKQLWGTEADFGFSKTQEEAFARWGHDRVLYDAVLAVRSERPQVIVSTFVGGITDGHGQHQVSGEIAQEVFKAAADPSVFPEQLKPASDGGPGLTVWQPLAVYSMVPFAPVTEKGMFDYATGKWAPAKFHNYVTGEWTTGVPTTDVTLEVGAFDPTLGRSYVQIAREGWGEQKSQNGGANPTLSGPSSTSYHLWAVAPQAKAAAANGNDDDLFHNSKVQVDTRIAGLAALAAGMQEGPALSASLRAIDDSLAKLQATCPCEDRAATAHQVAAIYQRTVDLRTRIAGDGVEARTKASILFELDTKIGELQSTLAELLGLDVIAYRTNESRAANTGFRGSSADETARSVSPGEAFKVHVHATSASAEAHLARTWFEGVDGKPWKQGDPINAEKARQVSDAVFDLKTPEDAPSTAPFFTRPSIEQPYYDISRAAWRERSFAPWPVSAWVEFSFDGVPVRVGRVVQTLRRVTGPGGIYEPLVVTPAIGVRVEPAARILPMDGSALPVRVTVHTQGAAEGTVKLKLPAGWQSEPAEAKFQRKSAGDTEPILFSVTPAGAETGAFAIEAEAASAGRKYEAGWQSVGYAGLRSYNQYESASLKTRKIDVKLAPGLKIGYVMGTGDLVPAAIEGLGATTHLLSPGEVASADLSQWNVLVIGIRAYSVRPDLAAAQSRLDDFVRQGGTVIVQYQSANFPAPLPLSMGRMAERVVDESAPVKLLDPKDPLLNSPNAITAADFDGWVEERGHSFLDSWDNGYTALTETADAGQDPQRGGLLITHQGKGTYIYVAYALYRQLPELVPGAYRILANLLSAGRSH